MTSRPVRNRRPPVRFIETDCMLTCLLMQYNSPTKFDRKRCSRTSQMQKKRQILGNSDLGSAVACRLFTVLLVTIFCKCGHEMITCDCSQPKFLGAIDLHRFFRCDMPPKKVQHNELVSYEVFPVQKPSNKFQGYACRQRAVGMKVQSF